MSLNSQNTKPKFQEYIFAWLKIFTSFCLLNTIFLYFFNGPEFSSYESLSMQLPFWHLGILGPIIILNSWTEYASGNEYIKKNHPKIYSQLHGGMSHFQYVDGFAGISFIRGKFDDGKDPKLNEIKCRQKTTVKQLLWASFLVPIIWFANVGVLLLSASN